MSAFGQHSWHAKGRLATWAIASLLSNVSYAFAHITPHRHKHTYMNRNTQGGRLVVSWTLWHIISHRLFREKRVIKGKNESIYTYLDRDTHIDTLTEYTLVKKRKREKEREKQKEKERKIEREREKERERKREREKERERKRETTSAETKVCHGQLTPTGHSQTQMLELKTTTTNQNSHLYKKTKETLKLTSNFLMTTFNVRITRWRKINDWKANSLVDLFILKYLPFSLIEPTKKIYIYIYIYIYILYIKFYIYILYIKFYIYIYILEVLLV